MALGLPILYTVCVDNLLDDLSNFVIAITLAAIGVLNLLGCCVNLMMFSCLLVLHLMIMFDCCLDDSTFHLRQSYYDSPVLSWLGSYTRFCSKLWV